MRAVVCTYVHVCVCVCVGKAVPGFSPWSITHPPMCLQWDAADISLVAFL